MTPEHDFRRTFAELFERHAGIVWKVAYAWCRQTADRDDLVQEIALQAWLAFSRYDANRPFSTWLYRIALNIAISTERRRKRAVVEPLEGLPEPAGPTADSADALRIAELFAVIDQFAAADRALLLLWLDDHSYATIADILGISATNVATRLNRLKLRLKASVHGTTPDSAAPPRTP